MERSINQRIKTVKAIRAVYNLSLEKIQDVVYENGGYVSPRTVQKIFAKGSENKHFRYSTIDDIYNAMMNTYGDSFSCDTGLMVHPETYEHRLAIIENSIDKLWAELTKIQRR